LDCARDWVTRAASLAVLTGAGISAESGVPTFRGAGGLWKNYKPEDLATPEAFARDPRLVRGWYNWRRELLAQAQPKRGASCTSLKPCGAGCQPAADCQSARLDL